MFKNYLKINKSGLTQPFKANNVAQIYKFPPPSNNPVTVSVISFGGGLFGNVSSNGTLSGGDVQAYWTSIGILPANQPKVIIIGVDGAKNLPVSVDSATSENTIDVAMIGACCPTSKLTILLFISANNLSKFQSLIISATTPVRIDGILYTPSVLSISWGAAEIYYTQDQLLAINSTLTSVTMKGINVCAATGDLGSNNGVPGNTDNVDFPSSSPNVTACGGTTLVCPTLNYSDATTLETAWPNGGGGVSRTFSKPSWQNQISGAVGKNRCTPDVALVADPSTGVEFIIDGTNYIYGGTSIVAPAMAAYYACLNTNKFLLPLLYAASISAPNSFHDIKSGSNGSYTAVGGFDLCTGFGSIAGDILTSQLVKALPPVIVPVTGISFNTSSATINIGNQISIIALIAPANATNKNIIWTSDNIKIATVVSAACPIINTGACDSIGVITGIAVGTTIITATADGKFIATASITVVNASNIPVTGISLDVTNLALTVGSYRQLVATIIPPNATNTSVQWSSSSYAVTVNNTGLITAYASGSAYIRVKTVDGGFTAQTLVTVTAPLIGISFVPSSITLFTYTRYQSNLVFNPSAAKTGNVIYTSSSPDVAYVNASGVITTVMPGRTVIQASANGKTASLTVFVIGNFFYYATQSPIPPIKTRKYYDLNPNTTMRR
jgi:uncharacterized protein YjdB